MFYAIVLVESMSNFLYCQNFCFVREKVLIWCSNVFTTTVVLPLSAGSTMMSVFLFRSWRGNRSCLVMFGGGGLALERILVICLRILSACSEESVDSWLYLANNFFGIFLGATAKLGLLTSADIVSWDRFLLDRFLTLSRESCGFLWGTRFMYFCFCLSEDCVWVFMACSYVIQSRVCQISCCNVIDRNKWSLKILWEIWTICNLVKWVRSLMRRLVLWRMFLDLWVPGWSLSCKNFGMILLSLQHFGMPSLIVSWLGKTWVCWKCLL